MRSNRLIFAVVIAGLAALSTNAPAIEPGTDFSKMLHPTGVVSSPGTPSGPAVLSDACPAENVGVLNSAGGSIVGSTIGSADDFDATALGCGDNAGGNDEIFEFMVDGTGIWSFDTCTVPACWDTSLSIREETGGGCPGDFVACDGDGCNICAFESALYTLLTSGTTYYLIVDGWTTYTYGDFAVTYVNAEPACGSDAECDDAIWCNGQEACDVGTGSCLDGTPPCERHQTCDEAAQTCIDPDPCITWRAGSESGFFFPQINLCPDTAIWLFDDIQTSKHATDILDFYTTPIVARSITNPLGTTFLVNQALWTVEEATCNPLAIIAGTTCTGVGTVDPGGSPAHDLPCSGTMPLLPNNDGDFARCEIDFFIAFRTSENGAGTMIAAGQQTIGGPAARDDFGADVIWVENCPPTGVFFPIHLDDDSSITLDFATAEVCQKPAATCCDASGACTVVPPSACMGVAGEIGTITDGPASCGGDPDEDGIFAACDNCLDHFNPDQGDCDGDVEGDACEADEADQDADGDGVCNGVDNCPLNPDPNQDDTDGDGAGDPCDPCPIDPNDDSDGDGVCDSADICQGHDDNADADGDGVPDGCDDCPGSDDNLPGARDDTDGDGVLNCNDRCPVVDDTVFAPECEGAIPTTSEWGLVVLTLLLLTGGNKFFGIGVKRVARS